jgi:hypothetical protein
LPPAEAGFTILGFRGYAGLTKMKAAALTVVIPKEAPRLTWQIRRAWSAD